MLQYVNFVLSLLEQYCDQLQNNQLHDQVNYSYKCKKALK